MDTERLLIGLAVAVLLPDSLPVVRKLFIFRATVTLFYSVWIMLPVLPLWKTLPLAVVAVFWSCSLGVWENSIRRRVASSGNRGIASTGRGFGVRAYLFDMAKKFRREIALGKRWAKGCRMPHRRSAVSAFLLVALTGLVVCLAIGPSDLPRIFFDVTRSNELAIVVSGVLAAAFVSHEVVARVYSFFDEDAPKSRPEIFSFKANYAYIGWFERALVFAFVASGQAAAAALAITAKSLARHKQFDDDSKFGERFIIGTFVSVLFAILWAVLVRMSLGLKPM